MKKDYIKHNLYVQSIVPAENLLVWNLKDGWVSFYRLLSIFRTYTLETTVRLFESPCTRSADSTRQQNRRYGVPEPNSVRKTSFQKRNLGTEEKSRFIMLEGNRLFIPYL